MRHNDESPRRPSPAGPMDSQSKRTTVMTILPDATASANPNDFDHRLVAAGMAPTWTVDPLGTIALAEHRASEDPRVVLWDNAPAPAGTTEITRVELHAAVLNKLCRIAPRSRYNAVHARHVVALVQLLSERSSANYGMPAQGRCEHWYSWLAPRVLKIVRDWLVDKNDRPRSSARKLGMPTEAQHRHRGMRLEERAKRAREAKAANPWAVGQRMVAAAMSAGVVLERADGSLVLDPLGIRGMRVTERTVGRRAHTRVATYFVAPGWMPAELVARPPRGRRLAPKTETSRAEDGDVVAPKTESHAPKTETKSSSGNPSLVRFPSSPKRDSGNQLASLAATSLSSPSEMPPHQAPAPRSAERTHRVGGDATALALAAARCDAGHTAYRRAMEAFRRELELGAAAPTTNDADDEWAAALAPDGWRDPSSPWSSQSEPIGWAPELARDAGPRMLAAVSCEPATAALRPSLVDGDGPRAQDRPHDQASTPAV